MSDIVTVIITTFKRPELLNRSLTSALHQTYPNVEVIVVDDNNPDDEARRETECLIEEKFSRYNNLRYLKLPRMVGRVLHEI